MEISDIKLEIRRLMKLKRQCRAGTEERLALYRQIKQLKKKLMEHNAPDEKKDKLIEEIKKLDSDFEKLGIDLRKHTIDQLAFHLTKLKEKNK